MASLHLLRILDYWLFMRKYHMIIWPFSSPKQLLVQLVTNIFMVEELWKEEKPNNWIWLFLIVEVPPLIVNLLPSCYGLLLKITWVLTPKIASAIIWWSVTKYVAKLSKCTSIKALSNIWSTNSNHTSPLSKQYFFTFEWKLFLYCTFGWFSQGYKICWFAWFSAAFLYIRRIFTFRFICIWISSRRLTVYIHCIPYSVIIFDVCQQWISFAKKNRERIFFRNVLAVHIFSSFKRKFKDEIS